MKLTGNEERFCQELIKMETMPELKLTQLQCYKIAYPEQAKGSKTKTLYENASRKASDSKIITRTKFLREEVTRDIKYDIEDCFKEFEDLQLDAKTDKDRNIQKACIENKGKLKGLFVDKKDITSKGKSIAIVPSENKEWGK